MALVAGVALYYVGVNQRRNAEKPRVEAWPLADGAMLSFKWTL